MGRAKDAEAELNLPPGFRFHPTDEELVVYYLCRKAAHQGLPVPIIAEVDLYKYDPWELPEKALFGQREWYFFTPRDRKYPKGSRPNRAAGGGYWKATGADRPIAPAGSSWPLGIKKALVFYSGKSPNGVKTDWIMHEYRLADDHRATSKTAGTSLRLDDWVLCRLYNKKNNWGKTQRQAEETSAVETMGSLEAADDTGSDSFRTPESDVDDGAVHKDHGRHGNSFNVLPPQALRNAEQAPWASTMAGGLEAAGRIKEEDNWFRELNLDGLQNSSVALGGSPSMDLSYQDYLPARAWTQLKPGHDILPPF